MPPGRGRFLEKGIHSRAVEQGLDSQTCSEHWLSTGTGRASGFGGNGKPSWQSVGTMDAISNLLRTVALAAPWRQSKKEEDVPTHQNDSL